MMRICIKDKVVHFHGIFGCYEKTTALSSLANSVVLWLSFGWYFVALECTCDAQSSREVYQKLCKAASFQLHEQLIVEEMTSWLEASCRAITSPRIVLHHYQVSTKEAASWL